MSKEKNKKMGIGKWAFLIFFVIYLISPKEDEENNKEKFKEESNQEYDVEEEIQTKIELSDIEIFANNMSESSDSVDYKTAENLYLFLQNDLLFEKIKFKEKNSVGDILFDVSADNYILMISIDNEGIYSVRCGTYTLYDGEVVSMTKQGLDDRSIGDYESQYYVIAQEIVSNNLKAPKSAEFPALWSGEVKMQRNKDIVAVQSYVDAMNSFGTLLRNEWLVEFKVLDIETFSYEVIYINIDGTQSGDFIELN